MHIEEKPLQKKKIHKVVSIQEFAFKIFPLSFKIFSLRETINQDKFLN